MKRTRRHSDISTAEHPPLRSRAWALLKLIGPFAAAFILVSLVSGTWRAVAYSVVGLFGFLVLLAVYFWGAIVLGGFLESILRRRTPVPWELSGAPGDVPEHDLDPGLELLAAGMLVYRTGEVKPRVHFRTVPLGNMRALRPFIVARTGAARAYQFDFELSDEQDRTRFAHAFKHDLAPAPQLVMPAARLAIQQPDKLDGSQWAVQVRAGVTVVTTFRFSFVNGAFDVHHRASKAFAASDRLDSSTDALVARLLDKAVKRDAETDAQAVILEDSEL